MRAFVPVGEFVYDERDGAVASDVAGCAEAVHSYVERNHECERLVVEAEHRREYAESSHDSSARYARRRHHRDAQHEDEARHHLEVVRNVLHHHQRQRTRNNLHRTAREVDGGAERNDEARNVLVNAVVDGLAQRDGDGSRRRLRAESREVSRHHVEKQAQRVLANEERGYEILENEQEDVHHEDYADNLYEHAAAPLPVWSL